MDRRASHPWRGVPGDSDNDDKNRKHTTDERHMTPGRRRTGTWCMSRRVVLMHHDPGFIGEETASQMLCQWYQKKHISKFCETGAITLCTGILKGEEIQDCSEAMTQTLELSRKGFQAAITALL